MKKILIAVLLIIMFSGASYYEHNYTREMCEVIQVNDGYVTAKDKCGYVWDFKGDGFKVGDIVDLKMYDSNTDFNVDDDVVKNAVLR